MNALARLRAMLLMLLVIVFFTATPATAQSGANKAALKVMTYNVDEGTDFAAITAVLTKPNPTITELQGAIAQTITDVQSSRPDIRMQLIANEIAQSQPDLVGLQEAAVWTSSAIPDGGKLDLLQLILDDLAALKQHYAAVVTVPEFQLDQQLFGVGFVDQDVILARTDEPALQITRTGQGHYKALITLPEIPSLHLPATSITRGWGYVNGQMKGTKFRFITTHLEDGTNSISPLFAQVQALQAIQLVYSPALTALPVIIGGDFNTIANDPTSPTYLTYLFMLANGFTDAWTTGHSRFGGATCCQENLTAPVSELTQRIDLVFRRNHINVVGAQLVGDAIVPNVINDVGFWPSDHAAVESELQVRR